jgi:hypothetical protein
MKRLIGLFVCSIMVFSVTGLAYNVTTDFDNISMDDDVPIWENGYAWRYNIGKFSFQLNQSGQLMSLDMSLTDLLIDVIGTTTTSYKLSVSGNINGLFDYDDGAGTKIGGILFITKISSGEIKIRQADLAAEQAYFVIKSIALVLEHPLAPIPIPIPLTITINIIQETPRSLIDFPLYDGKEGIIPESDISANIRVESFVLKILHSLISSFPEEIYVEQNVTLPMLLYTATEEQVSVEAGNYTAYNIEFFQGLLGSIYYAPVAGNYIKAVAEINTMDIMFDVKGELKDTTYR